VQLSSQEIGRKLLHLFALLMPAGIFYAPQLNLSPALPSIILAALFVSSVVLEFARFRVPAIQNLFMTAFGSMLRKEESFKITGSTWIIGAAFLCSVLFAKTPYISFIVLSLFVLGDAAAALVGISIGRIKIGKKSLEGSLACFGICVLLAMAVFPLVPGLLAVWNGIFPLSMAVVTALVITSACDTPSDHQRQPCCPGYCRVCYHADGTSGKIDFIKLREGSGNHASCTKCTAHCNRHSHCFCRGIFYPKQNGPRPVYHCT
jgi:dolichol kinase